MTDRYAGCWVAFDRDIREDDVQPLINAILMLKGVTKVNKFIDAPEVWVAQERVKRELGDKLWEVLHPKENGNS